MSSSSSSSSSSSCCCSSGSRPSTKLFNSADLQLEFEVDHPKRRLRRGFEVELLLLQSVPGGLLELAAHHRLGAHNHRAEVVGPIHRDEMEIGGVVVERKGSHGVFEVRGKSIHRLKFDVGPVDVASRCSRDVLPVVREGLRVNASVLGAGAERNEEDTAFQLGIHLKRRVCKCERVGSVCVWWTSYWLLPDQCS